MKHAGPAALEDLADVLAAVRRHERLRERSRGIYYLSGRAFLHFHEDPAGPFADLQTGDGWLRLKVATKAERDALLTAVGRVLGQGR